MKKHELFKNGKAKKTKTFLGRGDLYATKGDIFRVTQFSVSLAAYTRALAIILKPFGAKLCDRDLFDFFRFDFFWFSGGVFTKVDLRDERESCLTRRLDLHFRASAECDFLLFPAPSFTNTEISNETFRTTRPNPNAKTRNYAVPISMVFTIGYKIFNNAFG